MKLRYLLLALPIVLITAACKHEAFRNIGGKGGNAQLMVYPQHHGDAGTLDSMVVYIKYDAKDVPANGKYDDSATCTRTGAIVSCTFSSLWNGDYYLYAKGFDQAINEGVKGGIKYTVTSQSSMNLALPVTEE